MIDSLTTLIEVIEKCLLIPKGLQELNAVSFGSGKFFNLMGTTALENFKVDVNKLLGHLTGQEGKAVEDFHLRALMFGDYMDPKADIKVHKFTYVYHKIGHLYSTIIKW